MTQVLQKKDILNAFMNPVISRQVTQIIKQNGMGFVLEPLLPEFSDKANILPKPADAQIDDKTNSNDSQNRPKNNQTFAVNSEPVDVSPVNRPEMNSNNHQKADKSGKPDDKKLLPENLPKSEPKAESEKLKNWIVIRAGTKFGPYDESELSEFIQTNRDHQRMLLKNTAENRILTVEYYLNEFLKNNGKESNNLNKQSNKSEDNDDRSHSSFDHSSEEDNDNESPNNQPQGNSQGQHYSGYGYGEQSGDPRGNGKSDYQYKSSDQESINRKDISNLKEPFNGQYNPNKYDQHGNFKSSQNVSNPNGTVRMPMYNQDKRIPEFLEHENYPPRPQFPIERNEAFDDFYPPNKIADSRTGQHYKVYPDFPGDKKEPKNPISQYQTAMLGHKNVPAKPPKYDPTGMYQNQANFTQFEQKVISNPKVNEPMDPRQIYKGSSGQEEIFYDMMPKRNQNDFENLKPNLHPSMGKQYLGKDLNQPQMNPNYLPDIQQATAIENDLRIDNVNNPYFLIQKLQQYNTESKSGNNGNLSSNNQQNPKDVSNPSKNSNNKVPSIETSGHQQPEILKNDSDNINDPSQKMKFNEETQNSTNNKLNMYMKELKTINKQTSIETQGGQVNQVSNIDPSSKHENDKKKSQYFEQDTRFKNPVQNPTSAISKYLTQIGTNNPKSKHDSQNNSSVISQNDINFPPIQNSRLSPVQFEEQKPSNQSNPTNQYQNMDKTDGQKSMYAAIYTNKNLKEQAKNIMFNIDSQDIYNEAPITIPNTNQDVPSTKIPQQAKTFQNLNQPSNDDHDRRIPINQQKFHMPVDSKPREPYEVYGQKQHAYLEQPRYQQNRNPYPDFDMPNRIPNNPNIKHQMKQPPNQIQSSGYMNIPPSYETPYNVNPKYKPDYQQYRPNQRYPQQHGYNQGPNVPQDYGKYYTDIEQNPRHPPSNHDYNYNYGNPRQYDDPNYYNKKNSYQPNNNYPPSQYHMKGHYMDYNSGYQGESTSNKPKYQPPNRNQNEFENPYQQMNRGYSHYDGMNPPNMQYQGNYMQEPGMKYQKMPQTYHGAKDINTDSVPFYGSNFDQQNQKQGYQKNDPQRQNQNKSIKGGKNKKPKNRESDNSNYQKQDSQSQNESGY